MLKRTNFDRWLSANPIKIRHRLREIRFPSFLISLTESRSPLYRELVPTSETGSDMLVKRESYVIVKWRKAGRRRVMQEASSRSRKPRSHEIWQLFRNVVILDPMSCNYRTLRDYQTPWGFVRYIYLLSFTSFRNVLRNFR